MMTDGRRTRLDSDRDSQLCTYYPEAYGDGRFLVRDVLATAGQGYTLLVKDTWSGAAAVLKGMWFEQSELDNPLAGNRLSQRNGALVQGIRAAKQATQLTQQAPAVIEEIREPSPTLLEVGVQGDQELFVVQQFIGHNWTTAMTLKDDIYARRTEGRKFTEGELLDLADQLCNTLAALHTRRRRVNGNGITYWVHVDIKPENILLLGPPWRYVLIDYDAAVEKGEYIATTTDFYAPPGAGRESERNRADQRFDLYMLGTTLAEAAGLCRLDEDSRLGLYRGDEADRAEGRRRLADLGYGPILTSIIVTCLTAPDFRYSDVGVVQHELTRARRNSALHRALADLGT
jgi:serine/threonine protein kinase